MNIVEWLDAHQGFVFAILTCAYLFTTSLMARRMRQSNDLVREQLAQARTAERERARPYLVFDLESRRRLMYAVLRNIGETPAFGVRIDVDPPLRNNAMKRESSLTQHVIEMVAPHREFTDVLNGSPGFYSEYESPKFKIRMTYSDGAGTEYDEHMVIDMTFAATLVAVQGSD